MSKKTEKESLERKEGKQECLLALQVTKEFQEENSQLC